MGWPAWIQQLMDRRDVNDEKSFMTGLLGQGAINNYDDYIEGLDAANELIIDDEKDEDE